MQIFLYFQIAFHALINNFAMKQKCQTLSSNSAQTTKRFSPKLGPFSKCFIFCVTNRPNYLVSHYTRLERLPSGKTLAGSLGSFIKKKNECCGYNRGCLGIFQLPRKCSEKSVGCMSCLFQIL